MPPRRSKGAGTSTASDRLKEQIKEGQSYEALQTARALFARLEGQDKSGQARSMALEVARTFAEAGETKSVLDLARLYMANNTEHSASRVVEVTSGNGSDEVDPSFAAHHFSSGGREQMLGLAFMLSSGGDKVALLKGLSRWAIEETRLPPDSEISLQLAATYRDIGDYGQAAQKLSQATDAEAAQIYVLLLKEWSAKGYESEKDLFVARALLHILGTGALGGVTYAKALYEAAQADPDLSPALVNSPLIHFIAILLDLIQYRQTQGSQEAFRMLANHYHRAFASRDQDISRYVGKIAEVYFGLLPPPNPMQSLLSAMMGGGAGGGGGLLGSLLGGGARGL